MVIRDKEVLLEAADILKEKGWITGTYTTKSGKHCLVGAVQLAARRKGIPARGALEALRKVLGLRSLTYWNDFKAQGSSEVIKVLRIAATHEVKVEEE